MKNNKTVLITGASSGIGLELCKLFAKDGYNLVLVARNKDKLSEIASELRDKYKVSTKVILKDLSKSTSPEEIYTELQNEAIYVNVLVNNAGFGVWGNFQDIELSRTLDMIQVNLISLTKLTKFFLSDMLKSGEGKILNISSAGSFTPDPHMAVYGATKSYVLSFSEALAEELHTTGITVTTLCPGPTKTEFAKRANMENSWAYTLFVMDAKTVAKAGYDGLMKGKRVVIPGILNKLFVLSIRFLPKNVIVRLSSYILNKK